MGKDLSCGLQLTKDLYSFLEGVIFFFLQGDLEKYWSHLLLLSFEEG